MNQDTYEQEIDLFDIIRYALRHWKLMIVLPVVCAVVCAAYFALKPATYSATAVMSVSSEAGGIGGVASALESELSSSLGAEISTVADTTAKTITVTANASGASAASDCVTAVNDAAEAITASAATVYPSAVIQTTKATSAKNTSKSLLKYTILAFIVGAFLSCLAAAVLFIFKTPVISLSEADEFAGIVVLGACGSDHARRRLYANIGFAAEKGGSGGTVCLVPVGPAKVASDTAAALVSAAPDAASVSLKLTPAPPITGSIDAAFTARDAGATVVVVRQWLDTKNDLIATLRELKLAGVTPVGLIIVPER